MRTLASTFVVLTFATLAPAAAHAARARYQPADQGHAVTQHAEDVPDSEPPAPSVTAPVDTQAAHVSLGAVAGLFGAGVELAFRYEFVELGASVVGSTGYVGARF